MYQLTLSQRTDFVVASAVKHGWFDNFGVLSMSHDTEYGHVQESSLIASAMMMVTAPAVASNARVAYASKHHDNLFGASAVIVVLVAAAVGVGAAAAAGAFSSSN